MLKEISPGVSLEGMMVKLKLQYFGHLMWRVDSLEKTLMLGGIGGRREGDDRGWDGWMASLTRWTWVWVNCGSWWWTGRPGLRFMGSQRVGHNWTTELNWTEMKVLPKLLANFDWDWGLSLTQSGKARSLIRCTVTISGPGSYPGPGVPPQIVKRKPGSSLATKEHRHPWPSYFSPLVSLSDCVKWIFDLRKHI